MDKKLSFWQTLQQEINAARNVNSMILIQMDANAKLGKKIIKQDPHNITENGKLLKDLIESESLSLLNSSDLCKGAITRHRVTKNNEERSILDFILVCEKMVEYFELMFIVEERNFPLTKYATTKGVRKIVESDHNILYAKFSIDFKNSPWKQRRGEVFNLKNPECQAKFTEVTNDSLKLRKCFNESQTFPDQCNRFFKSLDDILHQCFRRIKVGKPMKNTEIEELLHQKSKLKVFLSQDISQEQKLNAEKKLTWIEEQISRLSSSRNMKIVEEQDLGLK